MPSVLVVDDDPVFLSDVADVLNTAGYSVLRAANGTEGIGLLEKNRTEIALAIVDLALPDVNGFELIGAMARRANTIKVIATTGIYKDSHLEMAATLGADAALRKPAPGRPLPEREWIETVERLIGKPSKDKELGASPKK